MIAAVHFGWLDVHVTEAVCPIIFTATEAVNVHSGSGTWYDLKKSTTLEGTFKVSVDLAWTEKAIQRKAKAINFDFMILSF